MIQPYSATLLYLPTFSIFIITIVILNVYIKDLRIIFFLATLKSLFFFLYFNIFFDGTFTFLDDWHYISQANDYLDKQFNFFTLIQTPLELIFVFSNNHFLYQLYNVFSFHLFGPYYFSPVALNVILTSLTSYIMYKFLILNKFKKKYAIIFSVFYLFYWETLNWSTFLNLKDTLVQFLSLLMIYNILYFEQKKNFRSILVVVFLVVLFTTVRFYLPYLIFLGYLLYKAVYQVIKSKKRLKILYFFLFIISVSIITVVIKIFFAIQLAHLLKDFVNPLYGVFRFILTPVPFHIEKAYSFLFFSSILNWLSLPFLVYGIYKYYKLVDKKIVIFVFSYLFIILLFYGSYGELQGPRHRMQIIPYISMFQLLGFLSLFYSRTVKNIFQKKI